MGDETRVVSRVLLHQCFVLAKTRQLYQPTGVFAPPFPIRSTGIFPADMDEPGQGVVVSAALGEWLRGLGPGSLHEVSHAGRNGTQALGRSATSF
jgi:hypothetical protein